MAHHGNVGGRAGWRAAGVVALLLTGCSSSSVTTPDAGGHPTFAGTHFQTATAVAFARGERGVAMVDGLAADGSGPHARVRFIDARTGERETFDAGASSAIVGPVAWMSGDTLFVTGAACPRWSRAAARQSHDGSELDAICGADRQVLLRLDLRAGTWRTVSTDLPSVTFPLHPSRGEATVALLGADLGHRLGTDGRVEALETASLPEGASFTPCVTSRSALTIAWSNGAERTMVGAYVLRGRSWVPTAHEALSTLVQPNVVGCTSDGLLVKRAVAGASGPGASSTVLLTAEGDRLVLQPVDPPPSATLAGIVVEAGGTPIARGGPGSSGFALRRGRWVPLDISLPGPAARAQVLVGDRLDWTENTSERAGIVQER